MRKSWLILREDCALSCSLLMRPRLLLVTADAAPVGAKGLGTAAGWLVAQVGTLDGLRAAVAAVRGWARRTGRTVEVSIGGDVLKVTGVTSQQQGEIIDAWLARHAAGD